MKKPLTRDRIGRVILLVSLLAAAFLVPGTQLAGGVVERLTNGDFEEGFYATPAGMVGNGWSWFHSGGGAAYGFYQDGWAPVVFDGTSSQLIEISTLGQSGLNAPHYAGIYQTVAVAPGATYELTVRGMLRALEDDPDRDNYSYRVECGVDLAGGTSWESVTNWVELPWDTVYPRLVPGAIESYSTTILAAGPRLTLFLRVWYKWPTQNRELDVNLDGISLKGALPATAASTGPTFTVVKGSGASRQIIPPAVSGGAAAPSVSLDVPAFPVEGWEYPVTVVSSSDVGVTRLALYEGGVELGSVEYEVGPLRLSKSFHWRPEGAGSHILRAVVTDAVGAKSEKEAAVVVGKDAQFLINGSFEQGFTTVLRGRVGAGWGAFDNGGRADFGFYEDTWPAVVYDGQHSQLVEISTRGMPFSEPDRYAGIWQAVKGLTEGAAYRLSLKGMIRLLDDDPDADNYGYLVQWGYAPGASADWRSVHNWVEIPWYTVYERLDPGQMSDYSVSFVAPSSQITLFLRVWKKWGTLGRELDVNLDAISLHGYQR